MCHRLDISTSSRQYLEDPDKSDWHNFSKGIKGTFQVDDDCAAYFHTDGNESVHGTGSHIKGIKEGINKDRLESISLSIKFGLYEWLLFLERDYKNIFDIIIEHSLNINVREYLRLQKREEFELKRKNMEYTNSKIKLCKRNDRKKRKHGQLNNDDDCEQQRRSKRLKQTPRSYSTHPLDAHDLSR